MEGKRKNKYYVLHFITEWTDCDNIVISLHEVGNEIQIGIVNLVIFKEQNRKGEGFIYNLYVCEDNRGKGYGKALLDNAMHIAKSRGCNKVSLEWDGRDSPYWVLRWYENNGFEEKSFAENYSRMEKILL